MSNAYNSLSDTFVATDLYNLPLPVLPPADLSITEDQFCPSYLYFRMGAQTKVVGFNKRDKPFFRAVGMSSNLADGLVDAASAHFGNSSSWRIQYQLKRYSAALTGNIANAAGSAAVVGTGTKFTLECSVAQIIEWLDNNGCVRTGQILSITNDLAMTLTGATPNTGMFTANTSTGTAYTRIANAGSSIDIPFLTLNTLYPVDFFLGDVSKVYAPLGTISTVAASAAIVGVGTSFVTDFVAGQTIAWGVGTERRTGTINAIADQTNLTVLAVNDLTRSGVALLDYDDHLRIKCSIFQPFLAYTVSMDPAYGNGTRRLGLHAMATVEHSFPLSTGI